MKRVIRNGGCVTTLRNTRADAIAQSQTRSRRVLTAYLEWGWFLRREIERTACAVWVHFQVRGHRHFGARPTPSLRIKGPYTIDKIPCPSSCPSLCPKSSCNVSIKNFQKCLLMHVSFSKKPLGQQFFHKLGLGVLFIESGPRRPRWSGWTRRWSFTSPSRGRTRRATRWSGPACRAPAPWLCQGRID